MEEYNNFDWKFYISNYNDLKNIITKKEAYSHWLRYGKKEDRIYKFPIDFNWKFYKNIYNDLKEIIITKEDAIYHWINYGKKEDRIYKIPDDFDWHLYIKIYNDLNFIKTKEDALHHWINYGKSEGRLYKVPHDFNWKFYINYYIDISNIVTTEEDAKIHYIKYGRFEGRIYKTPINKNLITSFKNNEFTENDMLFNLCVNLSSNNNINAIINYDFLYQHYLSISIIFNSLSNNTFLKTNIINLNSINNIYNSINNINLYTSFILYIDFPDLGGGTTFFTNLIINKYKYKQTFLIVRNINNKIEFNINNEYKLDRKYNEDEAILFLEENKEKIIKIFINHTIGHTKTFLSSLKKLEKEITTITHDYYMIMINPTPYYHEINESNNNNLLDINMCDTIITQNEMNLVKYSKYINSDKKIILSPLPDFKNSDKIILSNNEKLVIGIVGYITDIKGKLLIEFLINYYSNNNNILFIIFGKVAINYEYMYSYNNINELNELFIEHKPNILVDLSLVPETYSYTLSIAMITDLPIVYLKKPYASVIENRLSNYKKSYSFNTINEFNNIIFLIKQDYLYTIEPVIYFNSFWDNYFMNNNLLINNIYQYYPTIFSKYIYNFSRPDTFININKINNITLTKKELIHIHCNDLNLFSTYFEKYIDNCLLLCDIIVTYNINNNTIIDKYYKNIQFLNIENKGYDIGGKICCIKYLYDIEYDYKYIIFLHSKSDKIKRDIYMLPFIKNYNTLNKVITLAEKENILGIFPNLVINESKQNLEFFGTYKYREEILHFLNCNNFDNKFVEGNVMLLKKKIIDFVFMNKCELFYNLLNDINSIDINWFKFFYKKNNLSNDDIYHIITNNKNYYTNDFQVIKNNDIAIRDCMFEHLFERIWLNVINHFNGEFFIL